MIPCGISDKDVTSMQVELGRKMDMGEVKEIYTKTFKELFAAEVLG
jgi:lipoyl(octanoyl) transferase